MDDLHPVSATGTLGPRLAGRLTAELILRSPQYMSCVKLYHLDLRGNRVSAIENLGATQNQFDSIDLSDNNIVRLEGIPHLDRMTTFICNNNRISSIAPGLDKQLPKLDTLVLSNNKLNDLGDVAELAPCKHLTNFCMLDNPVARRIDFRLFAIYHLKSLKVLNFSKVTIQERVMAQDKFLTDTIAQVHQKTHSVKDTLPSMTVLGPVQGSHSSEHAEGQQMAIKIAIQNAASLEEVQSLEVALKAGSIAAADSSTCGADDVIPVDEER